ERLLLRTEQTGWSVVYIGKLILEGSSQGQKRSKTQILTLSDPKIRGQEPKTLSKRAHNPLLKEAGLTKPTGAVPWLRGTGPPTFGWPGRVVGPQRPPPHAISYVMDSKLTTM